MKLVFCTNVWNHYQDALCRAFVKVFRDDFKMILFTPEDGQDEFAGSSKDPTVLRQPWFAEVPNEPWIVPPPKTMSEHVGGVWNRLLAEADVAIVGMTGGVSIEVLAGREREGKSTYFMGERLFKVPLQWADVLNARSLKRFFWLRRLLKGRHTSYLEISHDGHGDLELLHVCPGRIFQWGYFPPVSRSQPLKSRGEKLRLGWCGRMIAWKHVEYIIEAVAKLPMNVRRLCDVVLVGEGPERARLEQLTVALNVRETISFENFKPVAGALEFMRSLDVYMFPSDRGEGWGVALMEAMDKGCVPIANAAAGATLELVEDGKNGYVFQDGDIAAMARAIERLVEDRTMLQTMSRMAWLKMQEWSPENAVKAFLDITNGRVPVSGIGRMRG